VISIKIKKILDKSLEKSTEEYFREHSEQHNIKSRNQIECTLGLMQSIWAQSKIRQFTGAHKLAHSMYPTRRRSYTYRLWSILARRIYWTMISIWNKRSLSSNPWAKTNQRVFYYRNSRRTQDQWRASHLWTNSKKIEKRLKNVLCITTMLR
jgi:hypothetical protein